MSELEISPETHAAIKRAYDAPPEEQRKAAKAAVDLAMRDCIRHALKPVAGLALWIVYTQELARRYA